MLVPNQLLEICISRKTITHYQKLGYNVNNKDIIMVPPEHLPEGSHICVDVECDYCHTIKHKPYKDYLYGHTYETDACKNCISKKNKEIFMEKYGVDNVFRLKEIREKIEASNLEKYGVKNLFSSKEIQEKIKQTSLKKYGTEHPSASNEVKQKFKDTCLQKFGGCGPMSSSEVRKKSRDTCIEKYGVDSVAKLDTVINKRKQTCVERYGVENPMQVDMFYEKAMSTNISKYGVPHVTQSEEIKQKVRYTFLEKYGVDNPMKLTEVRSKVCESFYKNSTQKTSVQQIQLYETIKQKYPEALLNYPFSTCSLDIFIEIDGVKIDCEYDCWYWHQNQQRDIRRDKFLQSEGFKTLRIKSGRLLPTEQELFDAIDYLVNTEHHFKEIILSDWKEKEVEECQQQLPAMS